MNENRGSQIEEGVRKPTNVALSEATKEKLDLIAQAIQKAKNLERKPSRSQTLFLMTQSYHESLSRRAS